MPWWRERPWPDCARHPGRAALVGIDNGGRSAWVCEECWRGYLAGLGRVVGQVRAWHGA